MLYSDFYSQGQTFLQKLIAEADQQGVRFEEFVIDHICYRTDSWEAYEETKNFLSPFAELLLEAPVNGRPIASYKLKQPFVLNHQKIDLLEVPAPKKSKITPRGFEHVELVTTKNFDELIRQYANLNFDKSGMSKQFNPELEIILKTGAIKFHHQSLEKVIETEIRSEELKNFGQGRLAAVYLLNGLRPEIWAMCLHDADILLFKKQFPEVLFFSSKDLSVEEKLQERDKQIHGILPRNYRLPQQVKVFMYHQDEDEVRYLLLKRSPRSNHFWQGVTGAPYEGEAWEQAASREVFEETQIRVQEVNMCADPYWFPMETRWGKAYRETTFFIYEQVFCTRLEKQETPQLSDEHEAFEWCSYERALELLMWPNNKMALKLLHAQLLVSANSGS